jgi:DNA-binding phage protein
MPRHLQFDDQLRKAIDASDLSRYAIAKTTGIDEGNLSRFMAGGGGFSMESIIAICERLELELVKRQAGKPAKGKRK